LYRNVPEHARLCHLAGGELDQIQFLRTADLACSRSGKARTRFGVFLFFRDFDMDDGLLAVAFYDAVKSAQAVFAEVIGT
jgi:hypothetical protein